MEKEMLLVEELENSLIRMGIYYKGKIENDWESNKFDPTYFDTYISGHLYTEFLSSIYERIKPLNSQEISRFLTLSVAQFTTHTPAKREKDFILNYWNTYWYPNEMGVTPREHEEKYAKHILKHYANHFHLFKEATEKALEDFKSGLLGSPTTLMKTISANALQIKNESLNIFLKQLTYNYPYRVSTLFFKYSMRDNLDYLKQEILDNLITLSKDDRKPYLNKLKYNIGNNRQHSTITKDDINIWLKKYNIASEEDIRFTKEGNVIYRILDSEPPTMDEEFEENFNRDTHDIQFEFYNYYYGLYIDEAVKFIDEQINEHSPNPIAASLNNQEKLEQKQTNAKLKTNLSVPQLAYLFRLLNDLNPSIFEIDDKTDLSNFIANNFITKATEKAGISPKSVYNLFSNIEKDTANFWATKLKKMLEDARKV